MKKKDLKKFSRLMYSLAEVFTSEGKPSSAKTEIYFKSMEDRRIEDVVKAIESLIKTRIYTSFPKPAETSTY